MSAAFSIDPPESFVDCKQLVLSDGADACARARAARHDAVNVIMALGAAGALVGIVQCAMLGYDNLDKRPQGCSATT